MFNKNHTKILEQVHMKKYRIEDISWVATVRFGDFSRPKKYPSNYYLYYSSQHQYPAL